jgi:NAD(P)-dependent dehydrogenase (short-subunit alcohol dehydrogenase family)
VKRVLITGSNRGIGLEFAKQYLEAGWRVYATCRRPSEAQSLHTLVELHSHLSIHRLDITREEDLVDICEELGSIALDILINNAGICFNKRLEGIERIHYGYWLRSLEVNALGTVRVMEALMDNITRSTGKRVIAVISSASAQSVGDSTSDNLYHSSSKAALNAAVNCIADDLQQRNIGVLLLHPGEVITRTGSDKGVSPRESVAGMRRIIDNYTPEKCGMFFRYDGKQF